MSARSATLRSTALSAPALVLLGAVLSTPLPAAEWANLGPDGGSVTALAQATAPSELVFAGMRDTGVFRSADGGRTWEAPREGPVATRVYSLVADPAAPATLLAGTARGVYRTTDGGETWVLYTEGLPSSRDAPVAAVVSLAIHPDDPGVVLAVAGGDVWKSTDGGTSWSAMPGSPRAGLTSLVADPGSPETFYAGSVEGPFRSVDGGQTWQSLAQFGQPWELDVSRGVRSLAVDGSAPGTLYASFFGVPPNLARTTDGGATWTAIVDGLPRGEGPAGGWVLAAHPGQPGILYAASERGVFASADGGDHWTSSWRPDAVGGTGDAVGAALVTRGGAVLIGTVTAVCSPPVGRGAGGLLLRTDGGSPWERTRTGLRSPGVEEVVPDPRGNGVVYVLRSDGRVLRSEDDGATWASADPDPGDVPVVDLALDPAHPDGLYATTPRASDGFFRSSDRGRTWHASSSGGQAFRDSMAVLPPLPQAPGDGPSTLVTVGGDGEVWRSLDGGATFDRVADLLEDPSLYFNRPAVVAASPSTLYVLGYVSYVFCEAYCPGPQLFRSIDGGTTWKELDFAGIDRNELQFAFGLGPLRADPKDPAHLFLLVGDRLFRSTDRGESWSEIVTEPVGIGPCFDPPDLLVDPDREGTVYVSSRGDGVRRSTDGGATWSPLGAGVGPSDLGALALLRHDGADRLFAASPGGAWSLDLTEPQPPPPEPPAGDSFSIPGKPGFRVWARISAGDVTPSPVRREPVCIPETLCLSGAVPGRSEVFVRLVGPKPNGRLWPTLVKFTTSRVEVWIEQAATGVVRYYLLPGAAPGVDELPGLFDREGFTP